MKFKKMRPRRPTVDEQHVLEQVTVRLVRHEETARFDELIVEHHYLHSAQLVGEHLRYVVTYKGQWLALASWSAAALHIKARDQFIGWSEEQRRRRLPLIVNNSRLLVLPDCHYPNLISRFMKLMLGRLSQDWQELWGHPVALAETFVDPQLYQGTAYKVSGWCQLGKTAGWKRSAEDFYERHERPKQIWVRELVKKACVKLRAKELPKPWAGVEADITPRCSAKATEMRSLVQTLRTEVPECRSPKALAFPVAGMLALIAMAMFSGVRRGPQDLADYAATLSQGQLRALGFRLDKHTGRIRCPRITPFREVLMRVEAQALQKALLLWQEQLLGPSQDKLVIVDGKTLRHAHVELVSAVNGEGRWLGTVPVQQGSNEIPAARDLLAQLEVAQRTTLADAIHTQTATARQILFEGGGDYALTVKENQKDLVQTLDALFTPSAFPPSAHGENSRNDSGTQPGPTGTATVAMPGSDSTASEFSRSALGGPFATAGAPQGQGEHGDGLPDQQFDAR